MKLGVISLGCDKATVDTEHLVAGLVGHGATVTPALEQADVILVNTCGFIDAAKRESIEAMLEAGRYKKGGRCRAVVAVGCLVARYGQELKRELPEVDYFFGFKDLPELVPRLASAGLLDAAETAHPGMRAYLGATPHVRYLKISEGCDHTCAFCAIPLMRGLHHRLDGLALGGVDEPAGVDEDHVRLLEGRRDAGAVADEVRDQVLRVHRRLVAAERNDAELQLR